MSYETWLPDAWSAFDAPATDAGQEEDAFVAGWAAAPVPDAAPAPAVPGAFDVLPDFGTVRHRALAGDERAWAMRGADAADEREALVRAELARARADEVEALEAAHADALERAWAEGHAAGREAGETDAHAALAATAGVLDAAVGEVQAHADRWAGDLRAHVAALAVAVAQQVVGRAVAADHEFVLAVATRALAEFPAQEPLVVRVHPADLDPLKAAWGVDARGALLRWTGAERVARGGVLVEGRERLGGGEHPEAGVGREGIKGDGRHRGHSGTVFGVQCSRPAARLSPV